MSYNMKQFSAAELKKADAHIKRNYLDQTNQELLIGLDLNVAKQFIVDRMAIMRLSRRNIHILLEGEVFRDIEGFSRYQVSNKGNFIRKKDFIVIQQSFTPDGYRSIKLVSDSGKRTTMRSSRIVGMTFIKLPDSSKSYDDYQINHQDGIITRNDVENLEWSTPSENLQHAYDSGLRRKKDFSEVQLLKVRKLIEAGKTDHQILYKCDFIRSKFKLRAIREELMTSKV